MCDEVFGHRLMMDAIVPGGVRHDIGAEQARLILALLDDLAPRFDEVVRFMMRPHHCSIAAGGAVGLVRSQMPAAAIVDELAAGIA